MHVHTSENAMPRRYLHLPPVRNSLSLLRKYHANVFNKHTWKKTKKGDSAILQVLNNEVCRKERSFICQMRHMKMLSSLQVLLRSLCSFLVRIFGSANSGDPALIYGWSVFSGLTHFLLPLMLFLGWSWSRKERARFTKWRETQYTNAISLEKCLTKQFRYLINRCIHAVWSGSLYMLHFRDTCISLCAFCRLYYLYKTAETAYLEEKKNAYRISNTRHSCI